MSPFAHGCDPLCDECFAEHVSWFTGVCQSRGESWARAIANVIPIDRPWPRTAKMRAGALRKVADLTTDERLRERLADEVIVGAERWWNCALEEVG